MDVPERPDPQDCCNSGCTPCINDIYEENMRKYLEGKIPNKPISPNILSTIKYTDFEVVLIENISEAHILITFAVFNPVEHVSLFFSPGQHLILRGSDAGNTFTRAYTPLFLNKAITINISKRDYIKSKLDQSPYFQIVAKLYDKGRMSRILTGLTIGSITSWRGPYGSINYKPNSSKYLFMLGQGTGVTPLLSIATSIIENESDETNIIFFCCFKNVKEIILRDVFYEMRMYWNFQYKIFLSEGGPNGNLALKYSEPVINRKLNSKDIFDVILKNGDDFTVYLCGSENFMNCYKTVLKKNNIVLF